MYKITVIGTGYVGLTTGIGLANFGSNVMCVDIQEEKIGKLNNGVLPIYEPGMDALLKDNIKYDRLQFSTDIKSGIEWADIIFIAVGTPYGDGGKADLSAVYDVARTIGRNINGYKIVVAKSTVPVGTNEEIKRIISVTDEKNHEFDVVSNPEFLREGKAIYDFLHPDRVVLGTDNPRPIEAMRRIYRPLYLNEVPFIFTDLKTAELIKYSANCFLAMKITYINEIARLCDYIGADIKVVAHAVGKDGRIGGKFLHPGPGFGGSCFPKDTEALAAYAREQGMSLSLIETVIQSNYHQKLYVMEKIKNCFGSLNGVKLGILGLAFKSETDDMRDAPAIVIINELLKEQAQIKVYDPQAMDNARNIWGDQLTYGIDEYDTITDVDGLVILTEWNQFRNLNLERIASLMAQKIFLDLRNIYKREEVEIWGFRYLGIGQ